jgi:hypothetical protein
MVCPNEPVPPVMRTVAWFRIGIIVISDLGSRSQVGDSTQSLKACWRIRFCHELSSAAKGARPDRASLADRSPAAQSVTRCRRKYRM